MSVEIIDLDTTPDRYDWALSPMNDASFSEFQRIEEVFERKAEHALANGFSHFSDFLPTEILDAEKALVGIYELIASASAYCEAGFFIKAATLLRKAGGLNVIVGYPEDAAEQLIEAIHLLLEAYRLKQL